MLELVGVALTDERATDGRPVSLQHFINAIYAMRPIELARFAPVVVAHRDDAVAAGLLVQAEQYLVANFRHVFDPAMPGPVVLGGSVATHLSGLPPAIADVLHAAGHKADIRLSGDGSVGAAVLALRQQGVTVDEAMLRHIVASIAARAAGTAAG